MTGDCCLFKFLRRSVDGALMSITIARHVRFKVLYISQPSSAKQQPEMTKSVVRILEDEKYGTENKTNLHLRRI